MANPIIKTTLRTHDDDGNVVDIHPTTSDDQVINLEYYAKSVTCNDHTITITNGNGDTYEVEVDNTTITDEEIMALWDITNAGEKSY
jgi:hypothetical protein